MTVTLIILLEHHNIINDIIIMATDKKNQVIISGIKIDLFSYMPVNVRDLLDMLL